MAQIRRRIAAEKTGGPILLLDEHLPNQFYVSIADKLETRLVTCMESIKYFSAQLKTRLAAIEQSRRDGSNGAGKIGPKQVLELIRYQNEAFMKIASSIASVHREVDEVKTVFLKVISKMDRNVVNPFEAADRKEQAEKRLMDQKMKMETMKHQQGSVFGNVTNGLPIGASATPGAGTAGPAGQSSFLGGFGSPAPSTTTSAFGAPASSGFGFGASNTTGTSGGFGTTGSTSGPTVGFSLGGAATPSTGTTTSTGFGFGAPAASTSGAASNPFGIPPISTGATPSLGGFGTPATSAPSAFGSFGAKSNLGALDLATRSSPGGNKTLFGGTTAAAPGVAPGFASFGNPFGNADAGAAGRTGLSGKPKKKK